MYTCTYKTDTHNQQYNPDYLFSTQNHHYCSGFFQKFHIADINMDIQNLQFAWYIFTQYSFYAL